MVPREKFLHPSAWTNSDAPTPQMRKETMSVGLSYRSAPPMDVKKKTAGRLPVTPVRVSPPETRLFTSLRMAKHGWITSMPGKRSPQSWPLRVKQRMGEPSR